MKTAVLIGGPHDGLIITSTELPAVVWLPMAEEGGWPKNWSHVETAWFKVRYDRIKKDRYTHTGYGVPVA